MLSQNQKDDLVTSIYIETQRTFDVQRDGRKSDDQREFLNKVEGEMRNLILCYGGLPKLVDDSLEPV